MNAKPLYFMIAVVALALASAGVRAGGFAGLGEDASGFAAVVPDKPLAFPADFGAHPDYRIEWWYVTANLKGADGETYGVQWTLFRQATDPGPQREGWANQQVWMGHAAVSSKATHRFAETLARGGIGQAGVTATPFRAWIDDWSLAAEDEAPGLSKVTMTAKGTDFSYKLTLATDKAPVPQGDGGYSRKSDKGQASYYYSQPFFEVTGSLTIDGREVAVTGRAWMDREWSSQPLAADQKGWDWFSLHLASGEKLMLFRLRGADGNGFRAGTWIMPDATAEALASDDIVLTPMAEHGVAGRKLPIVWKVEVKSRGIAIETKALNAESWMGTRFPYWEGPITFGGSHAGEGYLEMTGY
jgi:predicted secreted hydrolase